MGQKKDLTGPEKARIVKLLSEGNTTCQIAKMLNRHHRTIKKFATNSEADRKKRVEPKRRKVTAKDISRIKREAARNPLATSSTLFQNSGISGISRSTRCRILRELGSVRKAQSRPPLNSRHRQKRQEWAERYLKTDFSKVLWTDEMRATLDGPDAGPVDGS